MHGDSNQSKHGSDAQPSDSTADQCHKLRERVAQLEREVARLRSTGGLPISSDPNLVDVRCAAADRQAGEERFRLLVDSVQDYAIFLLDSCGRVASWNLGAARIKGYQPEEIIGRHFSCFYPPEDVAAGRPDRELAIAVSQGHYEEEGKRIRKSGEEFWALVVLTALYDEEGNLQGFAKVTRDISDRKQAEQKTRWMVQLAVNAMLGVDRHGIITTINPQTEKLFGYSQDELVGQSVELLVPDGFRQDHPAQRECFFANPTERAMGVGRDLFARRRDGSEFPVEIGLHPVETDEGLLVLCSIVDITARRQAENRSKMHLAELAHAGRLSNVGEVFSGLAHELNQPLAAAANYARASARLIRTGESFTQAQLLEWNEKTAAQAERALVIVNRVATFAKKGHTATVLLDLNSVIEEVVSMPALTDRIDTGDSRLLPICELDSQLPQVLADKIQIEQVLVNLIRNGLEAMSTVPADQRALTLRTSHDRHNVTVTVHDVGPGIAAELLPKLFDPFVTTKPSGMGLGLSISASIIREHGGELSVESREGCGTTFQFKLPIAKQ